MNYLAFVGPALRLLRRGIDFLADKADLNPRASGIAALLGGGAAWAGLRPQDIDAMGAALVKLGGLVQAVAQAMGG